MLNFQLCIHLAEEAGLESKSEVVYTPTTFTFNIFEDRTAARRVSHPPPPAITRRLASSYFSSSSEHPTLSHHIQRTASENEQATGSQRR